MKKIMFFVLLTVFVLGESKAQFYAGGSVGNSFVNTDLGDVSGESFKYDGNSFGWKVFAGVGMMKFLGIEGGYRDLGKLKNTEGRSTNYVKTKGGDIALRGTINIGPVAVFGKAGAFFANQSIDEVSWEDNNTNFLWGLGAGLNLGGFGLRLEYESLGMESSNSLSMLSIGASIQFGDK
mgnify:CR=1 FL=1